jgi:membrane associated rhomboid family serine protease
MIPLRDDNPARTVPVVTRALIVVNVAAFLFELTRGPGLRAFVSDWGLVPARLSDAVAGTGSPSHAIATVFTSMFLHGGWFHVLGNMWYLWIFGDNVEDRLGSLRFVAFYLVSGLVSALVHVLIHPWSTAPTIGASGAIAGVLGAYALAFPRARVVTLVPVFFFFQIVALPALLVLGFWFVFQLFSGTFSLGTGATSGVAWWAHIAGFAFGFLAMGLIGRPPAVPVEVRPL